MCHHIFITILFSLFTFLVYDRFSKETGSVKVQVGSEVFTIEFIYFCRIFLWNMGIAKYLSYNCTVFTFCKCIVVCFS